MAGFRRAVVQAADAPLVPGRVYLAPGDAHLEVAGRARRVCRLNDGPSESGHRPSCDVMFASLARLGTDAVGVILTGMGRDGAAGLLELRAAGGRTLGQDAATSLVYGMPRAAFEAGAVEHQLGLAALAPAALALCAAPGPAAQSGDNPARGGWTDARAPS